ncbi:LOW QUALITY PROTEIN: cAMP-regulated phosphoprotein 21 [Neosynchiropus ocellatus]
MEAVVGNIQEEPRCESWSCSPPPCSSPGSSKKEESGSTDGKKVELQKHCDHMQPKTKAKHKAKLMRSSAVCEDYHPLEEQQNDASLSSNCRDNQRASCDEEEREQSGDPKTDSLSKESSVEYTDSTGIDLDQFIVETLNSNPRDRMMLLKLEQDMMDFINSDSPFKKFRHMSSYHRMLVHRVAAYFGMEHNVDQTGKSVIINCTSSTRIPEPRFLDKVHKDKTAEIQQWKSILKRDNSVEEQTRLHKFREKQSKSVEEREEEYQRARDRIFKSEVRERQEETPTLCAQENSQAETRAVEECNPYAETQRRRQIFRGSRDSSGSSWTGSSGQSSTDTDCCYTNDIRPWSSTDSDSSFQWPSPAPKPRQPAGHSWDARGAGSISLYRVSAPCPHPSSPSIMEEPAPNFIMENGIPPGSILLNPHTGQPFLNPDGTPVVYNPPCEQPIRSQTQQVGRVARGKTSSMSCSGLHLPCVSQVIQYPAVSYAAPQMLPVTSSQSYATMEDLSSQFSHVTVNCQSQGDAATQYPGNQHYVYAAPPAPPPPPNPPSFCQPSPQVPVYFYSQYSTSAQLPCRTVSPSHSQTQPAAGYTPVGGLKQSSQSVMGAFPAAMTAPQCSMIQGGVSMSYPQSKVVAAGEPGYCCVVPPPAHHSACQPPSCSSHGVPVWGAAQY